MDYSLLLAVHNVDETKRLRIEERNSGIIDKTHQQLSPVSEQPSTSDSNADAYAAATAAAAQGMIQSQNKHTESSFDLAQTLRMNNMYIIHSLRVLVSNCDLL
mgnify:CR=1 FL=1